MNHKICLGFFNVWLVFCHRNSLFLQIHTLSDRHTADSKRYYIVYWKLLLFFFDSIVCQAQRHREREKLRERDIKRELWKVVLFAQRGCDGGMLQRIHHEQNRYVTTKAMNYTHAKKKSNNAKWLVPPFYVRNMNTEGGKINSVIVKKK